MKITIEVLSVFPEVCGTLSPVCHSVAFTGYVLATYIHL